MIQFPDRDKLKILTIKAAEKAREANDFFWTEDACAPAMNSEELAAAADKSTKIYRALGLATKQMGVDHTEICGIINSLPRLRGESDQEYDLRVAGEIAQLAVRKEITSHIATAQVMNLREQRKQSGVISYIKK